MVHLLEVLHDRHQTKTKKGLMKLLKEYEVPNSTKAILLYELCTARGHKGYWLILIDTTIAERPLTQSYATTENEGIDLFLKAIESMK